MERPTIWAYGLAPDVLLETIAGETRLNSPMGSINLTDDAHVTLAQKLALGFMSETDLTNFVSGNPEAEDVCASFLFRLDQRGFLCRFVMQDDKPIAVCVPQRSPVSGLPNFTPKNSLRLSRETLLSPQKQGLQARVPGSWASMQLLDAKLSPLIFELSAGSDSANAANSVPEIEQEVFEAVICLFAWCGLLECDEKPAAPVHETLFVERTRLGFTRAHIGKTGAAQRPTQTPGNDPEIVLPKHDVDALAAGDPPFTVVSRNRQSRREQGRTPIAKDQLSELLFRCFHPLGQHHSYPSGGGLYALTAYLLVNRCEGLEAGLYVYDSAEHGLNMIAEVNALLCSMLKDAAASANRSEHTQVLLLLSADMTAVRAAYGDLAYALVLKEVGAVYQNIQLVGTAMKLATCPLGTANSVAFAAVSGRDLHNMPLVGEMMIGSID
ncbi:SagB family peptide dehydrogenase [Ruegeria lacuscaerulensis]|uniref:SagB family peptide dehydrogenase n=1 Tax=Ruegeria lacuscaerulensis TaxID=55218 RepID=UPI00147FB58E|nr:SagB family peptide dehydrogenase [Ruegeria lacuscaerulensis]